MNNKYYLIIGESNHVDEEDISISVKQDNPQRVKDEIKSLMSSGVRVRVYKELSFDFSIKVEEWNKQLIFTTLNVLF